MNIFALSDDPKQAARWHVDAHVGKMLIESAQLLSTAHRMLDASIQPLSAVYEEPASVETHDAQQPFKVKRKMLYKTVRLLPGEQASLELNKSPSGSITGKVIVRNKVCCLLTHQNHPCAIWARESLANYQWLYQLYAELELEFGRRRGKAHAALA